MKAASSKSFPRFGVAFGGGSLPILACKSKRPSNIPKTSPNTFLTSHTRNTLELSQASQKLTKRTKRQTQYGKKTSQNDQAKGFFHVFHPQEPRFLKVFNDPTTVDIPERTWKSFESRSRRNRKKISRCGWKTAVFSFDWGHGIVMGFSGSFGVFLRVFWWFLQGFLVFWGLRMFKG